MVYASIAVPFCCLAWQCITNKGAVGKAENTFLNMLRFESERKRRNLNITIA